MPSLLRLLRLLWLAVTTAIVAAMVLEGEGAAPRVNVLHFIAENWGPVYSRQTHICRGGLICEWMATDSLADLRDRLEQTRTANPVSISVAMYNIHTLVDKLQSNLPAVCELRANLTFAESMESHTRFSKLFDASFRHFDGFSTTSPEATVQAVYPEAYLFGLNLDEPLLPFAQLIQGGAYVASDCHRSDSANSHRDDLVYQIRQAGVRVDGLGRCMRSPPNAEGVALPPNSQFDLLSKRKVIRRYLFYMAFENSIESGYVTEKPFDALMAGTVPVYLGDARQLRLLLPHPKAAIFVEDFATPQKLGEYLTFLASNETAYEEHRAWRSSFSHERFRAENPLLADSWECRVCHWATEAVGRKHKRIKICEDDAEFFNNFEGSAVQGNTREVFLVRNGKLHSVPDLRTFYALGLSIDKVIHLTDTKLNEFERGDPLPRVPRRL